LEVALNEEESAALQSALRTYLSDLRMEIADTDKRKFKDGLRHEREVLNGVVDKLDAALAESAVAGSDGRSVVRVISIWWSDDIPWR